jgi:hypothetical protein
MVLNGYGWHFVKYSKSDDYHEAELQARAKKNEDSGGIQSQLLRGNGEKTRVRYQELNNLKSLSACFSIIFNIVFDLNSKV